MRVIVIGSGIAGLSAAIALRKVGVDVTVYERAPELREVGAGISLWANAFRALDAIGAGDSVRKVSLKLARSELRAANGHKVLLEFDAAELERQSGSSEVVRMVHRADLVTALASHLPPGVARYGHECVGVELHGTSAAVRFSNGQSDEADAVIGADGIRSAVRVVVLGSDEPRYSGYTCWRGTCSRPAGVEAGYVGEWWGRGQRLGITTLPDDRVYWFATKNSPPDLREPDERAHLQRLFAGWADPAAVIFATTPADRIFRNDIIDRPPARPWSKGRAGLVGDAAHSTTPNLGQGGCIAVEDAVALARHLATATDPARALDAFTTERFPRTSAIVRESWDYGRLAQKEGALACWLRDTMIRIVGPLVGASGMLKHARFDVGALPIQQR